ncbi:MAG: hypothetical protein DYG94_08370 [Leptolyngbya sp. PLA3]|nr:MAG: hypothetical protein EDM82_06980 [Cyanobacteria bacterium CYA]MCE7968745.1 hypothetical protein [Leptolyngbya sp. PL-A3]
MRLDQSDAQLGDIGTVYPFGVANRGFAVARTGLDTARLLNPYTGQVTLGATLDRVRVLTIGVPAPEHHGVAPARRPGHHPPLPLTPPVPLQSPPASALSRPACNRTAGRAYHFVSELSDSGALKNALIFHSAFAGF